MKNIYTLSFIILVLIANTGYSQNCNVSFDYNHSQSLDGMSESPPLSFEFFTFEDDGGDITSAFWDFGDGDTLTHPYPTHIYSNPGNYQVCMTAEFENGCSANVCGNILIEPFDYSCISFSFGISPLFDIRHSADSTIYIQSSGLVSSYPISYVDYGDGYTQTNVNTTLYHTYQQDGNYTLKFSYEILDSACTDTIIKTIIINNDIEQDYNVGVVVGTVDSISTSNLFFIEIDSSDINDIQLNLVAEHSIIQDFPYPFIYCPGSSYGLYSFGSFQMLAATYLVKAAVDSNSINYQTYMPTYNGGSLFWSAATPVSVLPSGTEFCIQLIQGNNPGGPGFIGGSVNEGANKTQAPGDPVARVEILLLTEADQPVAYTFSNQNGNWMIDNLAYGTYKVYPEIEGLITEPYLVTISESNQGVSNIYVSVNSESVNVLLTGVENILKDKNFNIFPNPATNTLTINTDLNLKNGQLTILNAQGQLVHQSAITNSQSAIDVSQLNSGIYFLSLTDGTQVVSKKFVKE